jgi:mRNA interferase RelE/StbE
MYKLFVGKSARKELDDLPDKEFHKIDEAILALEEEPRPVPQSKKLKGEDRRRLRVGDYRVIYSVEEKEKRVVIHRVRHRREAYR